MTALRGQGILEIPGIALGHAGEIARDRLTGLTVVLPPAGSSVGVDVRGGGPATHETDVLRPVSHAYGADGIVLTGGSALGLRSVAGVSEVLAEAGRGFPAPGLPDTAIPIVPAAAIYDLGRGDGSVHPPTAAEGAAATRAALAEAETAVDPAVSGRAPLAEAAARIPVRGSHGVGIGARAGMQTLRSALGSAVIRLPGGHTVSALVAANPLGTIGLPTGELWAGALLTEVGWDLPPVPGLPAPPDPSEPPEQSGAQGGTASARNTTLAVVVTDADLDVAQTTVLAAGGHPGIARAVRPSHTLFDGDTVFAVATGAVPLPADPAEATRSLVQITSAAADAVSLAILDALVSAAPLGPEWNQPPTLADLAPDFVAAYSALP